jgi:hypothetical protein
MITQRPSFVAKYLPAFSELRRRIEELRPALIVAIARKGPRLDELSARFGSSIFPPNVPVVSQKALPFIDNDSLRGCRVAVFDDAVIWGSTMKDVFNSPVLKDVEITPFPLVASRPETMGRRHRDWGP